MGSAVTHNRYQPASGRTHAGTLSQASNQEISVVNGVLRHFAPALQELVSLVRFAAVPVPRPQASGTSPCSRHDVRAKAGQLGRRASGDAYMSWKKIISRPITDTAQAPVLIQGHPAR